MSDRMKNIIWMAIGGSIGAVPTLYLSRKYMNNYYKKLIMRVVEKGGMFGTLATFDMIRNNDPDLMKKIDGFMDTLDNDSRNVRKIFYSYPEIREIIRQCI